MSSSHTSTDDDGVQDLSGAGSTSWLARPYYRVRPGLGADPGRDETLARGR